MPTINKCGSSPPGQGEQLLQYELIPTKAQEPVERTIPGQGRKQLAVFEINSAGIGTINPVTAIELASASLEEIERTISHGS